MLSIFPLIPPRDAFSVMVVSLQSRPDQFKKQSDPEEPEPASAITSVHGSVASNSEPPPPRVTINEGKNGEREARIVIV